MFEDSDMKTVLFPFLGFYVILCLTSCAQQRMAQTSEPNQGDVIQAAVITSRVGDQAKQVLQQAGIQCIIEAGSGDGAGMSGVWVSQSAEHQAISVLQADPVIDKSMLVWPALRIRRQLITADAGSQKNGFLVFEVNRCSYAQGNGAGSSVRQSFKIPLSVEFLSQFKNVPSQNSSGTGFYCAGGALKGAEGSTAFMWWIRKTGDSRWEINMWGEGVETIDGMKLYSRNPKSSQYTKIKQWEDLDMTYMLSYVGKVRGMNIIFKARYVAAKDIDSEGVIPALPVKRSDQSELFKGDDVGKFPLQLRSGFQEG